MPKKSFVHFILLLLLGHGLLGSWPLGSRPSIASELRTNSAVFISSPSWLKQSRAQRVIDQIESKLEWDIRRIQVYWYTDESAFLKLHGFDSSVLAFTRRTDNTIHLGPRVTAENFDQVFGHELVHAILAQKYKDSIPKWLEEGMANYLSKHGKVDYAWLASQPFVDIRSLEHPFKALSTGANSSSAAKYHYQASTAAMEMIASHCAVSDLLQLSVGSKLESYLATYCELDDLNSSFQAWVKRKARQK